MVLSLPYVRWRINVRPRTLTSPVYPRQVLQGINDQCHDTKIRQIRKSSAICHRRLFKGIFLGQDGKSFSGPERICYEANRPIRQIYFPIEGVISWVQNTGEDRFVEVATVGNEGFVGVPVLLGADRTSGTSFCQIPGAALKIRVKDLQDSFATVPEFVRILQ